MRSVLGTFSYDQVCPYFFFRHCNLIQTMLCLSQIIADRNGLNQKLNNVIGNSIAVGIIFNSKSLTTI